MDETILTERPPLRKTWARRGEQALVPITGNRDKRMMYGALNIKTGSMLLCDAETCNQDEFQVFLLMISEMWQGWHIVLFLDQGSPHTADLSSDLADDLHIELRWLPKACPQLNPMDHLWRHLKNEVLPNEAIPMDEMVARSYEYFSHLRPKEILRKAGVLSPSFWLSNTIRKHKTR
jgi:hypothetical protein